jgi:DNA-binding transcriptional LysR family regulator
MDLRGVDVNLVLALRALLLERNVTRAAKRVGLGQSSMSHALARLRAHFDDPLLVPVGRTLVLTERAKGLTAPTERAVEELERVFRGRSDFDPTTSDRTFRLLGTDNVELFLLPKLAALLAREAPGVSLKVVHLPADWADVLRRGEADLKLGRRHPPVAGLRGEDLLEERFACAVRKGHPAPRRPTLAQYASYRHVLVSPSPVEGDTGAGLVDAMLATQGLDRRVAMTVPHFLVAPFVVAATDLVLTASERLLAPFRRRLGLRTFALPARKATYTLAQMWAERANEDPAICWLRSAVVRALRTA